MSEKVEQREEEWLSQEDFDVLDELIGRHGFGGYYDFLEVLKMIITKADILNRLKKDWEKNIKTLPEAVELLNIITNYE